MHVIALQNELDQLRTEYGDADLRANTLGKQVAMLTQQLEESHASVQDETKSKLALQAKLRAADDERNNLQQDLEEMEDMKLAAEKDKMQAQQQVSFLSGTHFICSALFLQHSASAVICVCNTLYCCVLWCRAQSWPRN